MRIRILYFAALRERMGVAEADCDASPNETVSALAQRLLGSDKNLLFAVNDEMVPRDRTLRDGDRLAFIPPVAGG
jgi:molybdopterin converting factor subunit 1